MALIHNGTVILAGVNPSGDAALIENAQTVLAAGVDSDGVPHLLSVDTSGNLTSGYQPRACIRDEKTQNTAGGTFTSGAWRTRDLNTELYDVDALVTVAGNQVTITNPGTYEIEVFAPALGVDANQARWQNITDGTTAVLGILAHGTSVNPITGCIAIVKGVFTITASKVFELQHRCQTTQATLGFGNLLNVGVEVYSSVYLKKIA